MFQALGPSVRWKAAQQETRWDDTRDWKEFELGLLVCCLRVRLEGLVCHWLSLMLSEQELQAGGDLELMQWRAD